MASFNNRLRQVISLHGRSERHRRFGPTFVRGKQALALKRFMETAGLRDRPVGRRPRRVDSASTSEGA